jgi:hypothetical protein
LICESFSRDSQPKREWNACKSIKWRKTEVYWARSKIAGPAKASVQVRHPTTRHIMMQVRVYWDANITKPTLAYQLHAVESFMLVDSAMMKSNQAMLLIGEAWIKWGAWDAVICKPYRMLNPRIWSARSAMNNSRDIIARFANSSTMMNARISFIATIAEYAVWDKRKTFSIVKAATCASISH